MDYLCEYSTWNCRYLSNSNCLANTTLIIMFKLGRDSLIRKAVEKTIQGRSVLQPFFETAYFASLAGMNYGAGAVAKIGEEQAFLSRLPSMRHRGRPMLTDVGANGR